MTYLDALVRIEECAKTLREMDGNLNSRQFNELVAEINKAMKVAGFDKMK